MQESKSVIISLHPEHANKILSGVKKLEFRRVWASKPVNTVLIYSTAPIQKIVAIAYVKTVHKGSPNKLWSLAKDIGGGLSRRNIYKYFKGRKVGFAVEFYHVDKLQVPVKPDEIFENFYPPQSFTYVNEEQLKYLQRITMDKESKQGKLIFISGVHGVGKTTMCESYVSRFGSTHKSASSLIKQAKADAFNNSTKKVKDIAGNQELLLNEIEKIRNQDNCLLLDGHFTILNADNQSTEIDISVFQKMDIDAIVIVHDEASKIANRVSGRDNFKVNECEIDNQQILEVGHAKKVAGILGIPFVVIQAFEQTHFDEAIHTFLK